MSKVHPTPTPGGSCSSTSSEPILAAALAKASPLPPSRRLLKRTSSTGYATMDCPYRPKRRRITRNTPPRIEFVRPGVTGYRHAPEPSHSSSSTAGPTSSAPVLPVAIAPVLLPVQDLDRSEYSSLYSVNSVLDLKNGFVDRQKIRT